MKKKDTGAQFRPIHELEKDITRDIELREIIRPFSIDLKGTANALKEKVDYFIEIETTFTNDFFFAWLPEKFKKYMKLFLPFVALIAMLNLPLNLEPEIKKALGLFLCIALLWAMESINIVVTALLIPVLAVILGLIRDSNPFASFSNPIIYLLLSGLIMAQAFRKHHLDKFFAVRVLALSKGKVRRLLLFTMIITGILGMWMSNSATIALLIPVIITISLEIAKNTKKDYTSMLLLASGFASSIGGLATILGGSSNAITAAFLRNSSEFTFLDWSVIGFPAAIILLAAVYLILLRLYSVSADDEINIGLLQNKAKSMEFTYQQKKYS